MGRGSIRIRCSCCGLRRNAWQIDGEKPPTLCGVCFEHRGVNLALRRAREHEDDLREALYAADKSARDAYTQRDTYRDKMRVAYRGRERALTYLDSVAAMHSLRSDGTCSCGQKRGCKVGVLMVDPWVTRELTKLDQLNRERQRELGYADPPDPDWLVNEWDRLDASDAPRRAAVRPGPNSGRRPA